MGGFQLDTSGSVFLDTPPASFTSKDIVVWSDLSPFCQGYVEAMLRSLDAQRLGHYQATRRAGKPCGVPVCPRYSWIAAATLSRIIADCELALERVHHLNLGAAFNPNDAGGRCFWSDRQAGLVPTFPSLTVTLGDDGLIYLREAA